jgi:DNA polymerase I-like protein with 3'-5' exonuclease and polymerase domains
MRDLLMSGMCPHIWFSSKVRGWDPDDAVLRFKQGDPEVKEARQTIGKGCLFGFPGGMGIPKFVAHVRKSGFILTETRAWELKNTWLAAFPEMPKYFRKIRTFEQFDETYTIRQLYSGRIRGGMGYTDACNTPFQGICADAMKEATWEIQKACYADRKNVLYGSRLVNIVHDEAIMEILDDALAHERAMELGRLMVLGARKFIKDVEVKATPCLMKRWTKGAKPLYSKEGRLIPV